MNDLELLNAENNRLTKLVIELRAEAVRLNAQAVQATPQPAQQDDDEGDALTIAYLHGYTRGRQSAETAQQPLTDEQCDAIYTALDTWARKADAYEFGLPRAYGGGAKGGREIIRNAISGVKND